MGQDLGYEKWRREGVEVGRAPKADWALQGEGLGQGRSWGAPLCPWQGDNFVRLKLASQNPQRSHGKAAAGGSERGHGFASEILAHCLSLGTRLLQTLMLQGLGCHPVQGADPAKNNLSKKINDSLFGWISSRGWLRAGTGWECAAEGLCSPNSTEKP